MCLSTLTRVAKHKWLLNRRNGNTITYETLKSSTKIWMPKLFMQQIISMNVWMITTLRREYTWRIRFLTWRDIMNSKTNKQILYWILNSTSHLVKPITIRTFQHYLLGFVILDKKWAIVKSFFCKNKISICLRSI